MKKTWISSAHQGFVLENMHSNTLSAFRLAAENGADMIETDVRATRDGVLVANHDPVVVGFDRAGSPISREIKTTDSKDITDIILAPNDPNGVQYVPTLREILHLAYFTGLRVNIDLKEGILHAGEVARLVCEYGMRGRVVYATNGSGAEAISLILGIDPDAEFIDTPANFTAEKLSGIPGYQSKCFVYTGNFSDENIANIRRSGCKLAAISLNERNAADAFRHHPDMAEYPHTSDFQAIDNMIISQNRTIK